ncbi:MAG: right-handed parallel beta-helix repeat-containing protein [Armatimonadota bacterium]
MRRGALTARRGIRGQALRGGDPQVQDALLQIDKQLGRSVSIQADDGSDMLVRINKRTNRLEGFAKGQWIELASPVVSGPAAAGSGAIIAGNDSQLALEKWTFAETVMIEGSTALTTASHKSLSGSDLHPAGYYVADYASLPAAAGVPNGVMAYVYGTNSLYVAESGAWVHVSQYIDVKAFGAKGDGIQDDTAYIQDAIDYAAGEVVFLPAGIYKCTAPITVAESGARLLGAGRWDTVIKNENTTGGHIIVIATGIRGCIIESLRIQGHSGGGDGIHISADIGHIQISDVFISPVGGNGIDATEGGGVDIYIENTEVNTCYAYGFKLASATAVPINTVHLVNCYANTCDDDGFYLINIASGKLVACSADNCYLYGYRVASHIFFDSCTAEANVGPGIGIVGSGTMTCINCTVTLCSVAFAVYGNGNVEIRGCATTSCTTSVQWNNAVTGNTNLVNNNFPGSITIPATVRATQELHALTTWDPANIADGASESVAVTVTGARLGSVAMAGFTSIAAAGWELMAICTASDTVTVKLTNRTGAPVDLASGTLYVDVWRH